MSQTITLDTHTSSKKATVKQGSNLFVLKNCRVEEELGWDAPDPKYFDRVLHSENNDFGYEDRTCLRLD